MAAGRGQTWAGKFSHLIFYSFSGHKHKFEYFLSSLQELPEVKERLLEVQSAFMSLLGDSNDLIQVMIILVKYLERN